MLTRWLLTIAFLALPVVSHAATTSATLQWTNGNDGIVNGVGGVTGSTIRRCTGASCTPLTALTTVSASNLTVRTYVNTGLTANTTYCYSVNNYDAAGNQSTYTSKACLTTDPTPVEQPTVTSAVADPTGADITYGATTPTQIRVVTGTNSALISSDITPISAFPAGRFTQAWSDGLTFVCFHPINNLGVENTATIPADAWTCDSLVGIVGPLDVTPPVLSNPQPTGTLPAGTTSAVIRVTMNKPANCRYNANDFSYVGMVNQMTVTGLTASATVFSLTNGSSTTRYVRCQSTDELDGVHPNTSSVVITILVASPTDVTPPIRSSGSPAGVRASGTTSVIMQLVTNENATCKYGVSPTYTGTTDYLELPSTFSTTGATTHRQTIGSLSDGNTYTYFIKCKDGIQNVNTTSFSISWSVTALPTDVAPPIRTAGFPSGTLAAGTTSIDMTLETNEVATCKYGSLPNIAYASLPSTFSTTDNTSHSVSITGLTDNRTFTRYVKCIDASANANTVDYVITWLVSVAPNDTAKPSTVTGLVATVSGVGVTLVWNVATDNVAVDEYEIYQSTDACVTRALVGESTAATFTILNLQQATGYCFTVIAVDTSGNASVAHSNQGLATTGSIPDVIPPTAMTNLQAQCIFTESCVLTWVQGSDDRGSVTSSIEQCLVVAGDTCSDFMVVQSLISFRTLSVFLSPATRYCFRGKDSDAEGNASAYSNTVCGTTLTSGLTQPRPQRDGSFATTRPSSGPRLPRS